MPNGMVWWRYKKSAPGPWMFGYASYVSGELVRMGTYNGDYNGGHVVSVEEIEWKRYSG